MSLSGSATRSGLFFPFVGAVFLCLLEPSTYSLGDNDFDVIDLTAVSVDHLKTLPAGTTPDLISDAACEDCDDSGTCTAGFAMIAPNGDVYFYDENFGNIKVLDIGHPKSETSILPGITRPPDDGVVLGDGTICLVRSVPPSAGKSRFNLYVFDPVKGAWSSHEMPELEHSGLWNGIPLTASARLHSSPQGRLFLGVGSDTFEIQQFRTDAISVNVVTAATVYEETSCGETEVIEPRPVFLRENGRTFEQPILPGVKRSSLGRDSAGNTYSEWLFENLGLAILKFDKGGKLLEAGRLPTHRSTKEIIGKGTLQVHPTIGLLRISVDKQGLAIDRLLF